MIPPRLVAQGSGSDLPSAWDGVGSSIIAAVIGALVAVLVVSLTNASARRSWYHQRRIETFGEVLTAFNECWEITHRNWDSYPPRDNFVPTLPAMVDNPERAPSIDSMHRRDQDLLKAVEKTGAAIELWSLYLDASGVEIEEATNRALNVLYGEWDYSSYLGRGAMYIPIPDEFMEEWKRYVTATHEWHRAHSARRKKHPNKELATMWRTKPKTKFDVMEMGGELRFTIE